MISQVLTGCCAENRPPMTTLKQCPGEMMMAGPQQWREMVRWNIILDFEAQAARRYFCV
jgi:hypothetical protein